MNHIGVVVIGRNEGRRLERCLKSINCVADKIVYVDSGSTDRSLQKAKLLGADVVELPTNRKFTAARALNAGLEQLTQSDVDFVQFLDGDVEVQPDWLNKAAATLRAQPELGVVCGRRREREPDASVYNKLCDMEWDTPIGLAKSCGGDAMFRIEAITAVGGYDPTLIAGEEPELCVRLRASGWKVLRVDVEMTLHDAAMTQFRQWWRRNVRNGHAFAEGSALHGSLPEQHWVKETRSNWIWGLLLPIIALAAAWPTWGVSWIVLLSLYLLQAYRVFRYGIGRRWSHQDAVTYAVFCVLGKFPQVIGQLTYCIRTIRGSETTLIEYKTTTPAGMPAMEDLSQ